jgi:hypothetical protein
MNAMDRALGKIKSIFFTLAEERRILPDELDDFNNAMQHAWEVKNEYDEISEIAERTEKQLLRSLDDAAIREKKLFILCEVLGMHRRGIERWNEYPTRFITIINAQLRKSEQPIYSELYFETIDNRWRWFTMMVDRDMQNVAMVKQMKELYRNNSNNEIKNKTAEILTMLKDDIGYLEHDIRKGKQEHELLTSIMNHWYEQLSADNVATQK